MMRAFITASISDEVLKELRKKMDVTYESWRETGNIYFDVKEMIEKLKDYDIFITVADDLKKAELFEKTNLKLIGSCRGDPFNINLEAATKNRIPVIYTPLRNVVAVAELTVGLIISLARNLTQLDKFLHSDDFEVIDFEDWIKCYNKFMGSELLDKTVGIIGFGQIGQRVAERLKPFGVDLLIYDPYVSDDVVEIYGKKTDVDTLMKKADFVSIHAAATDDNDNLINEDRIKMMKETAFLINLAKGSLVDYNYLYEALKNRKIAGAALDVFPMEPLDEDNEFLELDNVIVLPHIGGNTTEVIHRQSKMLLEDIVSWLNKGIPTHVLNPEVFKGFKEEKKPLDQSFNKFKEGIVKVCKKLLNDGHVIGSAGNVSMRMKKGDNEIILITPSNVNYEDMVSDDILIIDLNGKVIEGERNPSVEKHLHLGIYKEREDVNAIIHSHGVYSTILSTLNLSLPPVMEELVPYLGGEVVCSEYGEAGSKELASNVKNSLEERNAVILANHGSLCCGSHLEGAYTVLQYLERGCKVYYLAKLIKEPNLLPEDTVDYEMDIFDLFKDSKKI
jgi:D-3-phosphoglycerate dehydrogenase